MILKEREEHGVTEVSKKFFSQNRHHLNEDYAKVTVKYNKQKIFYETIVEDNYSPVKVKLVMYGFSLGYPGEGPRGLEWLLNELNIPFKDREVFFDNGKNEGERIWKTAKLGGKEFARQQREQSIQYLSVMRNRLKEITDGCREDMHEPDEQEMKATMVGNRFDNAMGDDPGINNGEMTIGLTRKGNIEWFNLATLIALARKARFPGEG